MCKIIRYDVKRELDLELFKPRFEEFNDLLKCSFNTTIRFRYLSKIENVFIVYDDDQGVQTDGHGKMVGCVMVYPENKIFEYNQPMPCYQYVPFDSGSLIGRITLYPMINALCRNLNEKYKGWGYQILQHIIKYYDVKGFEYIYLVAKSERKQITPNSNLHEISECMVTNHGLINYYTEQGFEIMDCYYDSHIDKPSGKYIHENVLRKKLIRHDYIGHPDPLKIQRQEN